MTGNCHGSKPGVVRCQFSSPKLEMYAPSSKKKTLQSVEVHISSSCFRFSLSPETKRHLLSVHSTAVHVSNEVNLNASQKTCRHP